MDFRWRFKGAALRTRRDQERAQVFSLYQQGPSIGQDDDGDDEVVPDRFGFLCEKPLPKDNTLGTKQRRTESRRLTKWVKMLKNYSKYHDSEKFHQRIFKGIPGQVRGKVWRLLLGVDAKKAQNPGKFEELKEQAKLRSNQFHQIDSAVYWTFRNHLMFQKRYGLKQRGLFEVLMAYAMYKPEVGYGQGLSHIAALLLMWLGEEDAFWALVQLMEKEKYSMDGLYKPGLPQLEKLQEHLGDTVQCTMPTLSKHLEEQGVSLKTCTTHWFTQCFLDAVPFHLALRIWDIFILEGAHVLTTTAYVTLKLNQKRLLKMPQDHIREFLQVTLKQAWDQDDNIVVKHLQASKKDLAKRQCLLPPQAMPGQSCSLDQQPVNVPEQPVPAPTTLQGTETAQAPEPLRPHPESSAPLAETPPVEPATFRPVCGKDEEEEEEEEEEKEEEEECIANEEPSESLGLGTPRQASGPSRLPSPAQTPWSVWDKGRLLQWWSLSRLWMPVQSADCPSPVLGTDARVRASSLPFLEPLGPGPMQAGPAPGAGLKTASLNNVQETCQEYADTDGLEPPRASKMMGAQPHLPSPVGGHLAAHSMGQLPVSDGLEDWVSPFSGHLRKGHSLPCLRMVAPLLQEPRLQSSCPPR